MEQFYMNLAWVLAPVFTLFTVVRISTKKDAMLHFVAAIISWIWIYTFI